MASTSNSIGCRAALQLLINNARTLSGTQQREILDRLLERGSTIQGTHSPLITFIEYFKDEIVQAETTRIENKRAEILTGLSQCTDGQHEMFRRMYAFREAWMNNGRHMPDLTMTLDEIVAALPEEKLDNVIGQIERTIELNTQQEENTVS